MKKRTTIFFDIDNTLLDHSGAEKKGVQKIRNIHFTTTDSALFEQKWKEKAKTNWKLFEEGKVSFEEQRSKRIKDVWEAFGKKISSQSAQKYFNEYLAFYEDSWKIFPHVIETFAELKRNKHPLGIITNGGVEQQIKKLKQIGVFPFLDKNLIVISEQIGISKPHVEIFAHALKISKKDSSEVFCVGDSMTQDILPAKISNWKTIYIDHYKKSNDKSAIHDFRDILKLIQI